MKDTAKTRRTLSLLLAVLLCMSFTFAGAEGTSAPENSMPGLLPRLPRRVTEYGVDFETKEWVPVRSWTYTYENGYPVLVDLYEPDLDVHSQTAYEYVFENGLPVKRTDTEEETGRSTTVEYANGRPWNILIRSADGTFISKDFYQYANGDDYFTLLLHEHHTVFPDAPEMNDDAEEADAVSVTSESGLLVKTVNTGMYANWGADTEKEWLRFNGTYTAFYDGDGIVTSTSFVLRTGQSGTESRFEAVRENGLITEATVLWPEDGSWTGMSRFVFEYTGTEISPARYATMINSFLMGESSNYYNFFWY